VGAGELGDFGTGGAYLIACIVPLLISFSGEFGKAAAADGQNKVKIPLATSGIACMPKIYCEGRRPLRLEKLSDNIFLEGSFQVGRQ
jgi:hypothetical protein